MLHSLKSEVLLAFMIEPFFFAALDHARSLIMR